MRTVVTLDHMSKKKPLPPIAPAPTPLELHPDGTIEELALVPVKIKFPFKAMKHLKKEAIDRGTHIGAILFERYVYGGPPLITRH